MGACLEGIQSHSSIAKDLLYEWKEHERQPRLRVSLRKRAREHKYTSHDRSLHGGLQGELPARLVL